jgi:hypothetical protein
MLQYLGPISPVKTLHITHVLLSPSSPAQQVGILPCVKLLCCHRHRHRIHANFKHMYVKQVTRRFGVRQVQNLNDALHACKKDLIPGACHQFRPRLQSFQPHFAFVKQLHCRQVPGCDDHHQDRKLGSKHQGVTNSFHLHLSPLGLSDELGGAYKTHKTNNSRILESQRSLRVQEKTMNYQP